MSSCNQERVVCLLLGGTGRTARRNTPFAAILRQLLHRLADVLAAACALRSPPRVRRAAA